MKAIYISVLLMAAMTEVSAQNIYSGGNSDGFSTVSMGFDIYYGGVAGGFAMDTTIWSDLALPVTLLDFTARASGSQVLLRWQTASELNNDHFDVQRSADGRNFSLLTTVAGHGNSEGLLDYRAIDPAPYAGMNYYRLKQVDRDARSQLSSIVSVNVENTATPMSIKIYPNPAFQTMHISVSSAINSGYVFSLYNADGEIVARQYRQLTKGENVFNWNISQLVAGIYHVKVEHTDIPVTTFVKP